MFIRTSIMEEEDENRPGVTLIKRVYLDLSGDPIPKEEIEKLKEEGNLDELQED